MTPMEVQELLLEASAFDGRPVTEDGVAAWHRILKEFRADQAMAAMRNHFATQDRRLMPSHVALGVRKLREDLMRGFQGPGLSREIPKADPDDVARYLAEGLEQRSRAGDGEAPRMLPVSAGRGGSPRRLLGRDPTATVVPCPNPECRAPVGRHCRTRRGERRAPHGDRLEEFARWKSASGSC